MHQNPLFRSSMPALTAAPTDSQESEPRAGKEPQLSTRSAAVTGSPRQAAATRCVVHAAVLLCLSIADFAIVHGNHHIIMRVAGVRQAASRSRLGTRHMTHQHELIEVLLHCMLTPDLTTDASQVLGSLHDAALPLGTNSVSTQAGKLMCTTIPCLHVVETPAPEA